jgi:hypothetical protein
LSDWPGLPDIGGDLVGRPIHEAEGSLGPFQVDVRDRNDVNTRDVSGLRQVHCSVPPGTDHPDPDGATLMLSIAEQFMQIHV